MGEQDGPILKGEAAAELAAMLGQAEALRLILRQIADDQAEWSDNY